MHPFSPFKPVKAINTPDFSGGALTGNRILPQFSYLIQELRKQLLNVLAQQVRSAFNQAENTLFQCAEQAENNQVQDMFFASIHQVREQHLGIERAFLKTIANKFDDFINGKLQTDSSQDTLHAEQLTLVKTDDFEESLLVSNMSSKVSQRCTVALHAIEQRLALINSGKKLGLHNPLAPTVIAQGFYTALADSSFNLQIKTTLYMLFEQCVMSSLDDFYARTNQQLIEAGILPNLKYSLVRNTEPTVSSQSQPPATATEQTSFKDHQREPLSSNQQEAARHTVRESSSIQVETIAALLNSYRQHTPSDTLPDGVPSITAYTSSQATEEYSHAQLLQSIAQLQKLTAEQTAEHFSTQSVEDVKAALSTQLKALHNAAQLRKIPEQHSNTIDLVGMLFNFMIEDASLSESSKSILSNLHSLYLQVALQDPSLFTMPQHPARKLLNTMAQAGSHYCGANEEKALQQKMQFTVNQALHAYQGDNTLFTQLSQDFSSFVAALSQRVELREKRAIEAAKGRDKLLAARNQARALVDSMISNYPAPKIIRSFLQSLWVDVLVFTFLRHGPASKQWQHYAKIAEHLAWSGTYLGTAEEQQRFERLRQPLLEELRQGLDTLGSHHPNTIHKLLQDIVACQHAVQAQDITLAESIGSADPLKPFSAEPSTEQADCTPPPISSLSAQARKIADRLQHIDFGTWFEFDSPPATLKLSWFSPTTHNYMFVDSSGQRVAIKALTTLAIEMEQNTARILPKSGTVPLMDRALNAIQKIFQHFSYTVP